MLHFVKIVALVQGVYLESLSKILPIDLFLVKKIPKKRLRSRWDKNVTFYKNCRSGTEGFPEFLSKILAFDLDEKQIKRRMYQSESKVTFVKILVLCSTRGLSRNFDINLIF